MTQARIRGYLAYRGTSGPLSPRERVRVRGATWAFDQDVPSCPHPAPPAYAGRQTLQAR
jgi:hypothetical protein